MSAKKNNGRPREGGDDEMLSRKELAGWLKVCMGAIDRVLSKGGAAVYQGWAASAFPTRGCGEVAGRAVERRGGCAGLRAEAVAGPRR